MQLVCEVILPFQFLIVFLSPPPTIKMSREPKGRKPKKKPPKVSRQNANAIKISKVCL